MGKYLATRGRTVVAQTELLSYSRYIMFIYHLINGMYCLEIFVRVCCTLVVKDLYIGLSIKLTEHI